MIGWLARDAAGPTVEIAGRVLPVALRRDARARRLTLRLAPDGSEVRLTLPRWCPEREALGFVRARTQWLADQLARVPEQRAPRAGGTIFYRGGELAIDHRTVHPRTPQLEDHRIVLGGPADQIAPRLQRWLERSAQALLVEDLAFYAARARIPTPQLRLSRAQRRWGSCSTNGTVRINWRLVQAPDAVRRSVVAHEVAHCLHFDHSPAFHAALGELFEGDLAAADAWIKAHGLSLYASFG
ncbi:SprT family zinc-dependent metalloprotease [Altererythrobacter sp. TH136]|uniref:M48 family metallopeptidase n=1 Tax=Altererythrobacter sp. TH136 TaxID=2067415 RepID=UPI001163DCC5|nr:SprT family zinc-dependent metalloprotease [Altererythrobacter sp. TH136]QDM40692.1 M48 family metallopeptidase [Altererythrobacter sp. TH136]